MPAILILSSQVAASRVGGGAQGLALGRLGIETILVPTVLFGRHPGHGPPGGRAVDPEVMQAMLEAIEDQGVFDTLDAVITGYFSLAEQVELAGEILASIRTVNPGCGLFVDPVMGDEGGGLYVNYVFTLVWIGDVLWWWAEAWRNPQPLSPRAATIRRWTKGAIHAFLGFIAFNATVVFATGFSRWFGIAACVLLALVAGCQWVQGRRHSD